MKVPSMKKKQLCKNIWEEILNLIPPFHWDTIRSRSEPIWKSGPIGNKRELNGSDRKLSGNERQRSSMVGNVRGDLFERVQRLPPIEEGREWGIGQA